ncbi:MAG: chromosome segregation protein SMC [Ignavibacteria bacterium]|nr:chromosome segregation protein SMC [Ignavibacteria bacterium]
MFLTKIELLGFKSFANKTTLIFNGGITAIVGPNGCGKTNVVDAVRWVLGEQKTSLLRSELMENVIFNGSSSRKPLGMAEVSITFQNDKGILPTNFSELTITRRLFRDGKSEYLINNTQCRLKDIADLFTDTGIGHNSYSIIELKMIETLLNGSLEERRRLLEEAAGIAKYKQRKKETTKKLDTVQNDLLRIYDLVNEIEQQVRSLSRQAAKTKRYNKIYQELKELELNLWLFQFVKANEKVAKLETENSRLISERESKRQELEKVDGEILKLQEEIDNYLSEIDNCRNEESLTYREFSNVQNQINLEQEKINNFNSEEKRIKNEIEELKRLNQRFENTYSELAKIRTTKEIDYKKTEETFNSHLSTYKANEHSLKEKIIALQEIKEKIINLENETKFEKLNIEKLLFAKNQSLKSKEDLINSIKELNSKIASKSEFIKGLITENQQISTKIEETKIRIQDVEEKKKNKKSNLDALLSRKNDVQISIKEIQTSLEFLKSILEVDESTRFLLKDSNWKHERNFSLLGEIISIDEQFRVAYDSLLGEFKNIVIVNTEEDILSAKEILASEHKGKCWFVCLNEVPQVSFENVLPEHPKIIAFASELPNVDNKIRSILRILLGNSVIVKDYSDAIELASNLSLRSIVTLSGELIWGGFIQKRGSILNREGLSIGKVERIKKLEKKYEELLSELTTLNEEIKMLNSELQILDKEHSELVYQSKELENKLKQNNITLSREEAVLEQMKKELISFESSINKIEEEYEKFNKEIDNLQNLLENKFSELNNTKLLFEKQEKDLQEFQSIFNIEQEKIRELEKNLVQIKTELVSIEKEVQRIQNSKNNNQNKLEKLKEALQVLILEREKKIYRIAALTKNKEDLEKKLENIKMRKELLIQKRKELEEILFQQEEYKNQILKSIEKIVNNIHQNELEITRQKEVAHSLFSKALDSYNVNLNNYVLSTSFEDTKINEVEYKISELRKTLASLGNVNFLALQEYEEQKNRLDLYKNQIEDLVKSEKSLKEALKEINDTAEKRFLETFQKVNENFNKVFKELFGGDSFAELIIDNSNPLDSDIEIKVKPSGKKINSLETLSQGEKTLTVLSLLFALYLVKPSPFCILDEVDAPLDDANVDRFLNLLKKFSDDVQFIIITHNKRTMEFANVMYGITMAEDGVSKVLSVKLVE